MNVYFIDPTYVKPEGWEALLSFLKVKAACSFIPTQDLPPKLLSIINPYLKFSYSNQDLKEFANNCVYWLRGHFEKNIRLVTKDFEDLNDCPKERRMNYSSSNALNNILKIAEDNCLFLLELNSGIDEDGTIRTYSSLKIDLLEEIPKHIITYCLNILHKKYNHYLYNSHSAFIMFDPFFSSSYRFDLKYHNMIWEEYIIQLKNGNSKGFMYFVNRGVHDIAPNEFPIIEVDGKNRFSLLRSEEGNTAYKEILEEAEKTRKEYEEYLERHRYDGDYWGEDTPEELNRAFWKECGEGGSNCESWPGWD